MNPSHQPLIDLIEELIAKEPHEADGLKWAARPQPFYCEKLNISVKTLGRWIAKPPVCRAVKKLDGKVTSLLRTGEPAPKDAKEYARILRGVWRNKTDMNPPEDDEGRQQWEHMKKCLWGYVVDVIALPEVQAFTDQPGELAVAAFKHALDNWQLTAGAIKFAAEAIPGYKRRFWYYPNIPTIRRFYKAVVHVHVTMMMEAGKVPAAKINLAAALLTATDPLVGHPGSDVTLKELTALEVWPLKEPWKPVTANFADQ